MIVGRDLHRRRGRRVPARGHDRRGRRGAARAARARRARVPDPQRGLAEPAGGVWALKSDVVLARVRSIPPGSVTTYGDLSPGAPRFAGRGALRTATTRRALAARRARGRLAGKGRAPAAAARGEGVPFRGERVDMRAAWCPAGRASSRTYAGDGLREDPLRGARRRRRARSPSNSPETPQRALQRAARRADRRLRVGARRRAPCAAWCSPPRTRRSSPPAATSTGSRRTCRSCTSTSAPSASRELFRLIGELGKPTICAANGHVLAGRARASRSPAT